MSHPDVIVIGGGPAGLEAARALAVGGHGVLVLEEHAAIGRPVHCTGVIGMEAFDTLPLPRSIILNVITAARFRGRADRSILVDIERVRAAVIDRAALDLAVAAAAETAGAVIETSARVERLIVSDNGVEVAVRGMEKPLRASACILACGANYRFHREFGLGTPKTFVQTAQVEIPFAHASSIDVTFNQDLAPKGFGWMVPFTRSGKPFARIGLMCASGARHRFLSLVSRLAAEYQIGLDAPPDPLLKILPLGPIRKTHGHRMLVAGDAAGQVKPTTGGGIYFSLLSGKIAGETLGAALTAGRLDEAALRIYEARWRKLLAPEIRAGAIFRTIVEKLDDRRIDALLELARADGVIQLLEKTARLNWHGESALALLRHAPFRQVLFGALLT